MYKYAAACTECSHQVQRVQVADAFNRLCDLKLTTRGLMEYAYRGEVLTPSQCGRMDQACAFGRAPVSMVFDGKLMHIEPLALAETLHFVVVDLKVDKDTTAILAALQAAYEPCTSQQVCARDLVTMHTEMELLPHWRCTHVHARHVGSSRWWQIVHVVRLCVGTHGLAPAPWEAEPAHL